MKRLINYLFYSPIVIFMLTLLNFAKAGLTARQLARRAARIFLAN